MDITRAIFTESWEDLTKFHRGVREQAQEQILSYIQQSKGVNPTAIWGPFGQGKSQLLYHLFKFVWQQGGQALFLPLEKLLPNKPMGSNEFAGFVKAFVLGHVEALRSGKLHEALPLQDMQEFVKPFLQDSASRPVVLFVDEMEGSYQSLAEVVWSGDRSPLRDWLETVISGDSGHYAVAAFAPMSYYESVVGEAEKTTWYPLRLPLLTAEAARQRDHTRGNLAWWMSRGRVRALNRSLSLLSERGISSTSSYLEWEQLSKDVGDVGGVPPIDEDTLAKMLSRSKLAPLLLPLEPSTGGTPSGASVRGHVISKQAWTDALRNAVAKDGLSAVASEHLAYYAGVALDGVSDPNGLAVFPEADFQEVGYLLKLALDLLIEWESEGSTSAVESAEYVEALLVDQPRLVNLFFSKLKGQLTDTASDTKGAILSFRTIYDLFPMPVVSPQFGGTSVAAAKSALGSTPVACLAEALVASKPNVTFKFFLNHDRLNQFLTNEEALSPYLPPPKSLVCIPLDGAGMKAEASGLAAWLEHENRLTVVSPRQMLGDFLACALAWAFSTNVAKGSIPDILEFLSKEAPTACGDDRAVARRLRRYTNLTEEFLAAFPSLPNQAPITLSRSSVSVRDVSRRSHLFEDTVGLAFVEGQTDLDFMYELRTTATGNEISQLSTGVNAVLTDASVVRPHRSKPPTHSLLLQNVKEDLAPHLSSLQMLAALADDAVFTQLAGDDALKAVLSGLHKFCRVSSGLADNYISELRIAEGAVAQVIDRIVRIKKERAEFESQTEIKIGLTASENALPVLSKLKALATDARSKNLSNYTRRLAALLISALVGGVSETVLHPDETSVGSLKQLAITGERYRSALQSIKKVDDTTYVWLGRSADQVVQDVQGLYQEAVKRLMGHQSEVDIGNVAALDWDELDEVVGSIESQADLLGNTHTHLRSALVIAESINSRLKGKTDG